MAISKIPPRNLQQDAGPGGYNIQPQTRQVETALQTRSAPSNPSTVTTNYTVQIKDVSIMVDASNFAGSTLVITLPDPASGQSAVTISRWTGDASGVIVEVVAGNGIAVNNTGALSLVPGAAFTFSPYTPIGYTLPYEWIVTSSNNVVASNSTPYNNGSSGSAATINWSNGINEELTITANCTLTFSNPVAGTLYTLQLAQGGSGGYTVTWPGSIAWGGLTAAAPPVTPTLGLIDTFVFYWNGSYYAFVAKEQSGPGYLTVFDNGSIPVTKTIDWTKGQNQKITITSTAIVARNFTLSMVNPVLGAVYTMEVVQGGTLAANTITWPGTVKFGSVSATLAAPVGQADLFTFYFNGASYVVQTHNSGYVP